jgi:hypothetical protein
MIDERRIEEAANLHRFELIASMHGSTLGTPMQCFEEVVDAETDLIENSFITGANWAINEFLKDLWHPASKKPLLQNGKCLVVYNSGKVDIFSISFVYEMLSNYGKDGMSWKYWAYVSDLFPKEGGEKNERI